MASLHLQDVLLPNQSKVNCISAFIRSFKALRSILTSLEKISFLPLFRFLPRTPILLPHLYPWIRISSLDPISTRALIPILSSTQNPLFLRFRGFSLVAIPFRLKQPRILTIYCQTRTHGFPTMSSKTTKIGSELWRTKHRRTSPHAALHFLPLAHFPPFSQETR